jgi:4-alpha-glucanotransferase
LRIDHVMGLFRLFWIPRGGAPADGAFVRYPADELLAVLSIESQRAQAVIVGEDLGTVEPGVRPKLRRWNVLSYRLLWFEQRPPSKYPKQSLAAVTTHDLFTIAGLWSGSDLKAQQQAGLAPNAKGMARIRRRLKKATRAPAQAPSDEIVLRAHRWLAQAPSMLITATVDDALAATARPNMPGTTTAWPNWSIPLPLPLEQIPRHPLFNAVARALAKGRPRGVPGADSRRA